MRVRYLDWLVVLTVLSTGCADPWALTPNSPPADAVAAIGATATPIQVFGSWRCGNDACTWASVRAMTDFVTMKHWLVDRGDGRPSVNVVVLSFVHPYRLLKKTTDAQTLDGVPRGMTADIVNYFNNDGPPTATVRLIRLSIRGSLAQLRPQKEDSRYEQ